jgi:hypothetical protein
MGGGAVHAGRTCQPTGFRKGCTRVNPLFARRPTVPPRLTAEEKHGKQPAVRQVGRLAGWQACPGPSLVHASLSGDQHQTGKPFARAHWLLQYVLRTNPLQGG